MIIKKNYKKRRFILSNLDRRILRRVQTTPNSPVGQLAAQCKSTPAVVSVEFQKCAKMGLF